MQISEKNIDKTLSLLMWNWPIARKQTACTKTQILQKCKSQSIKHTMIRHPRHDRN
jgi:hypothetical protein